MLHFRTLSRTNFVSVASVSFQSLVRRMFYELEGDFNTTT